MTASEEHEHEKAGLVARFPVSPDDVAVLWKLAEELAPYAGHRVRLLEHVIAMASLLNVSAETLLRECKRLALGSRY